MSQNKSISKIFEGAVNKILLACPYCGNIHDKHSDSEYTVNCGSCRQLIDIKKRVVTFYEAVKYEG